MTVVHRPLSSWIAHLNRESVELGPVNDGDDRTDARTISYFATGWDRVAVPWGHASVLGLAADVGEAVAVELDDYGRPIPVTAHLAELVRRIERNWPSLDPALLDNGFQQLADAALPLRYWLVERLDVEGDPPDEAFAILPWDLLDRAVASVTSTLDHTDLPGELVEIRHWLTPAVRGLTGPLEQLDHGLRTADGRISRLGATALLDNLRHIPLSRIPSRSLAGLVPLVDRLGKLDPLYKHASRIVRARLVPDDRSVRYLRVALNSALDPAANREDVREHSDAVEDDTIGVRFDETQAGWVRVLIQAEQPPAMSGPFADRLGAFVPVRVVPRDDPTEQLFWVALYPEGGKLVGAINFALPQGWSEIDCDSVPVTADDLTSVNPDVLLPSLHVSITPSAQQWLDIAEDLPPNHPARLAALRFEDSL